MWEPVFIEWLLSLSLPKKTLRLSNMFFEWKRIPPLGSNHERSFFRENNVFILFPVLRTMLQIFVEMNECSRT